MPVNKLKQNFLGLPRFIKRGLVFNFDLMACLLSNWLAFFLLLDQWYFFVGEQWWALFASIFFSLPLFIFFGLYQAIFRYIGWAAFAALVKAFISYTILYFFFFSVVGVDNIPRSIGIIQPLLFFIAIATGRYFICILLGGINMKSRRILRDRPTVLIYGAGVAGRQLASALSQNSSMLVLGFIDDDIKLQRNTIDGFPVHGNVEVKDLVSRLGISDIFLAIPSVGQARRNEIISSLNGVGARVRSVPGLVDIASGRVRVSDLHDLDMNDLLGRQVVPPNKLLLEKNIKGKTVLVTGAGGSIGSELCRQIMSFAPQKLILVENNEHALYLIYEELKKLVIQPADISIENGSSVSQGLEGISSALKLVPCLASVRDRYLILKIFLDHHPDTVFHAAAYKHVPLVEQNPGEGILNNVIGTKICAEVSMEVGVKNFILISTDKAVRPTNIMGASKRVAELILQANAELVRKESRSTVFSMVRFGNVLGSSGSVVPLFNAQIKYGGPITLTHMDVTRYFMTIPEAAQLVIQSSAMATGGDVFVLDMGNPVRIYDLAVKMIYLSGFMLKDQYNKYGDIEIQVSGLRPGEKLYEELLIGDDPRPTAHPKIMKAHEEYLLLPELEMQLEALNDALQTSNHRAIQAALMGLVSGYRPNLQSSG